MKISIIHSLPLLFIMLALATGCNDNLPNDPARLTGTLHGTVWLHDPWGKQLNDHSGVLVTLEGTRYQATTGANGDWSIPDLPAGTYNLIMTRDGFNENRIYSYGFVGGGDAYTNETFLAMRPANFEFTSFNVITRDHGLRFACTISRQDMENLPVVVYVGLSPDVSPGNHLYSFSFSPSHESPDPDDTSVHVTYDALRNLGGVSGSPLYCRAYLTASMYDGYYDRPHHRLVRTSHSLTSTNVASIMLP